MDSVEIFKSLGLKEEEISNIMNQIFKEGIETNTTKTKAMNFAKLFKELTITEEEINELVEILYAKIMFLASQNVEINNQTKKYILLDEDEFYHTFGITYEELVNIYPFKTYEENQAKRK